VDPDSLDVLYEGIGIKKNYKFSSKKDIFQLDPDSLEMLDPYPAPDK
jgi:hypothetical protein